MEMSYLCSVKRNRPTPDPSRQGGERPPGSGNDPMTERSNTSAKTNYSLCDDKLYFLVQQTIVPSPNNH